mmetsp:Transcript_28491/g.79826  ORF Transcript_28491/g.79826 Transcript_28491/m.79826 type:complete len:220 (+) Transcript_28491:610-1269(+)
MVYVDDREQLVDLRPCQARVGAELLDEGRKLCPVQRAAAIGVHLLEILFHLIRVHPAKAAPDAPAVRAMQGEDPAEELLHGGFAGAVHVDEVKQLGAHGLSQGVGAHVHAVQEVNEFHAVHSPAPVLVEEPPVVDYLPVVDRPERAHDEVPRHHLGWPPLHWGQVYVGLLRRRPRGGRGAEARRPLRRQRWRRRHCGHRRAAPPRGSRDRPPAPSGAPA